MAKRKSSRSKAEWPLERSALNSRHGPGLNGTILSRSFSPTKINSKKCPTFTNLKHIEGNDPGDLEDFEKQTDSIAGNLKYISENDAGDLEELEERLDRIPAKLQQVKKQE